MWTANPELAHLRLESRSGEQIDRPLNDVYRRLEEALEEQELFALYRETALPPGSGRSPKHVLLHVSGLLDDRWKALALRCAAYGADLRNDHIHEAPLSPPQAARAVALMTRGIRVIESDAEFRAVVPMDSVTRILRDRMPDALQARCADEALTVIGRYSPVECELVHDQLMALTPYRSLREAQEDFPRDDEEEYRLYTDEALVLTEGLIMPHLNRARLYSDLESIAAAEWPIPPSVLADLNAHLLRNISDFVLHRSRAETLRTHVRNRLDAVLGRKCESLTDSCRALCNAEYGFGLARDIDNYCEHGAALGVENRVVMFMHGRLEQRDALARFWRYPFDA